MEIRVLQAVSASRGRPDDASQGFSAASPILRFKVGNVLVHILCLRQVESGIALAVTEMRLKYRTCRYQMTSPIKAFRIDSGMDVFKSFTDPEFAVALSLSKLRSPSYAGGRNAEYNTIPTHPKTTIPLTPPSQNRVRSTQTP